MSASETPFRPLPISRIASVRRRMVRELAAAFRSDDCLRIEMTDGTVAKRFKPGATECLVVWAEGSGAAPEIVRW